MIRQLHFGYYLPSVASVARRTGHVGDRSLAVSKAEMHTSWQHAMLQAVSKCARKGHQLAAVQLRQWIDLKPADAHEEDPPPLIDCGNALSFFARAVNTVREEQGQDAVVKALAKEQRRLDELVADFERDTAAAKISSAGLQWLA